MPKKTATVGEAFSAFQRAREEMEVALSKAITGGAVEEYGKILERFRVLTRILAGCEIEIELPDDLNLEELAQ